MKKKALALAVAGALGAPALALAQASTVQIYGQVRVDYQYLKQGDGLKSVDAFSSYDSYLGFRGEEKLGGGLSAWFQCESTFDPTGESSANNGFCSRNTGVGFKGQWGNVFFGNWDTPYKIVHGSVYRPFSTAGAFGNANILHNGTNSNVGNGTLGGFAATGFSRRAQNMVAFHSGDFAGFQVLGAYTGTDESTSLTTNAAPTSKPRLYSLGATWTAGPLYIGAAYEEHKSFNPGQGQAFGFGNNQYREGTDHAWEIVAAFTLGPVRLGASYHELKYETAGAAAGSQTELKYKPWAVYADWRIIGPHTLRVEYLHAPNTKGNSAVAVGSLGSPLLGDTGAQLYGIQYAYAFSKRTEVNFGYVLLDNDRNSRFALQSPARMNTCQGGPAVGCNRDQSAYVLGVIHRF